MRELLSNRQYDWGKWLVLVLMPALAVLLQGLGDLWNWPEIDRWVSLVNLLTVFLGSVLQVSSYRYHQGSGKE